MEIDRIIEEIDGISLSQMDGVKLMNRTDRKFWFHRDLLGELLDEIAPEYFVLEINGGRNLPYSTTYFDTTNNEMYENHHRGKKNRYKIRRRNYETTNHSFLEVKFKNNKGRTIKVRRKSDYVGEGFNAEDDKFIRTNTPYGCDQLQRALENHFLRLMLVSKNLNERCTIDSQLQFRSHTGEAQLSELVIVEVKTDGKSHSRIIDALNRRRIRPSGFSKYCVGRSLTDSSLKQNNFKEKHREIEKRLNNTIK